jgi:hypothetical protein
MLLGTHLQRVLKLLLADVCGCVARGMAGDHNIGSLCHHLQAGLCAHKAVPALQMGQSVSK